MTFERARAVGRATEVSEPWQIAMFRRSLKKQQKLTALLDVLGHVNAQRCLLVTCGDNNGALNWHFRSRGGNWVWGDVQGENLDEMAALLGEPVLQLASDHFPFANGHFDRVVAIDVLEHLDDDQAFLHEVRRVLTADGRAIVTVPNGDPGLLANLLRWRIGMRPEVYGHTRAGYTAIQLAESLQAAGFLPTRHSGYSRFFTEIIELIINAGYVFVLRRKHDSATAGGIAPTSAGELQRHGLAYRLYSWSYPVLRAVSVLDRILPQRQHYAVIVEAVARPQ